MNKRQLVDDRVVRIEFGGTRKRDNFGRLLASVFVGEVDVEESLVRQHHAVWRD